MSYKQIHETFWTAPDVKKYKPMQRYLFGYFITSPHAHYSGLYYLPLVYIQNETGMTVKEIKEGINFLSEKGHIQYDFDREVIFVKSEILYQLDNKKDGYVILNEKHVTGLKKHFDTLHKSPLIGKFLELYNYLKIEYTGIDRGIDTPMDTDSVPVPVPVPYKEIVTLYHEILPVLPRVSSLNDQRRRYIKARWYDKPEYQDLEWWRNFFQYISQSKFLTGQSGSNGRDTTFIADLEWITKPNNFLKIIEGKYE